MCVVSGLTGSASSPPESCKGSSWLRDAQHLPDNPDSVSTLGRTELEERMIRMSDQGSLEGKVNEC